MSLRTRPEPLPAPASPGAAPRSPIPIARVPQPREDRMVSTWRLAKPARIAAALAVRSGAGLRRLVRRRSERRRRRARSRWPGPSPAARWSSGGTAGGLVAGPGACPHLGALLDAARCWTARCTAAGTGWRLTQQGDRTWSPYRAYDDGVLIWVGLPTRG